MTTIQRIGLTKAEAAQAVSVSEKTIERALKATAVDGGLPPLRCRRIGRSVRIDPSELRDWFESLPEG